MATFTGTGANETITPGFVSATVTRSPQGSFPGPTADTLDGGVGADVMDGGDNNDLYIVDNAGDVATEVFGDALGGIDTVQSSVTHTLTSEVQTLTLKSHANIKCTVIVKDNVITGNGGDNVLSGLGGNDWFGGHQDLHSFPTRRSSDLMDGGDNNDLYIVDNAGDVATEVFGDALGGIDTVQSSVTHTLTSEVQTLTLKSHANIKCTVIVKDNVITGNGGDNVLSGLGGNDWFGGHQDLHSFPTRRSSDLMDGGDNNDLYIVDNAGDVATEVFGDALGGIDTVQSSVTHTLSVNLENLTLTGLANIDGTGNARGNTIFGNTGNNTLEGKTGDDTVNGGDGDDLIIWRNGDGTDIVNGGAGIDTQQLVMSDTDGDIATLTASGANAVFARTNLVPFQVTMTDVERVDFQGQGGDDSFTIGDLAGTPIAEVLFSGGAGNDTLAGLAGGVATAAPITASGGDGNDTLTGGTAADTLNGDAGNDTLEGHRGNDTVNGGDGDDLIVWRNGDGTDIVDGGASTDTQQAFMLNRAVGGCGGVPVL